MRDENSDEADAEFSAFGGDQGGQSREPQPYATREPYQMREQQQQPREQQNWRDNRSNQQPQPSTGTDDRDIDRLPSFITGGQPQPNLGGSNNSYDNGPNGDRGNSGDRGDRGDRYPHRRRRRHHGGPRPDNQISQPVSNDDFGSGGGD